MSTMLYVRNILPGHSGFILRDAVVLLGGQAYVNLDYQAHDLNIGSKMVFIERDSYGQYSVVIPDLDRRYLNQLPTIPQRGYIDVTLVSGNPTDYEANLLG